MIPKGYKELGILPSDWQVVRLGEIGKIIGGGTPSTEEATYWTQHNGIVWLTPTEIKTKYITESQRQITKKGLDESSAKSLPLHTILITTRATIGDIGIAKVECATNQGFQSLICSDSLDYEYAYYALQAYQTQKYFKRFACGSTFLELSPKEIKKTKIPLPPLAEQEKIASVLSTWDRQIENLQSLITEKQNLKKGLAQTLLSAKLRLKGFNEDWQVVRLGEVCEMKKGEQLNKIILDEVEGYPVINGGILPSGFTSAYNASPNTITISEGGNSCGFVNYIQEHFWSGGHCYTLQNLKILDMFLFQVLKHNEKKIQRLRVGSGLPNIQKKDLEKFSISIPSKIEQEKIAEILSEADKQITLLEQKLESLKSQKKGLMQKLLNGKVRVK